MLNKNLLFTARKALTSASWETRYQGLEMLATIGAPVDIERIEALLSDPYAPVRVMSLNALRQLLAFESEEAIRKCLFDNDGADPYGSLEVRSAARTALDEILRHTRPATETSQVENLF